jgi:Tol biopolymer transport system component
VGIQGAFGTVPVSGTIVYLSNQNAFIMRELSGNKRPLTTDGDLDGRVLSLSRDGRWLLYTRSVSTTFNSLWIMDTTLAKPEPKALNLTGILWADFSPDGQSIAWSRGDPAPGLPGWKALNDLSIAPIKDGKLGTRREIVKASYAWWGTAYAWSPDSKLIAYANTEAIGVISPTARLTKTQVLHTFAAYDTRSTWAWTPVPAWSADSRFVIATAHAAPPSGELPEDSPAFEVITLGLTPTLKVPLAVNTGMWAVPAALPANGPIVFGVADTPYASEASRYRLDLMDRDGSNRTKLFPAAEAVGLDGLPEFAAAPDGRNLLIIYQGDLYALNLSTNLARRLTADGTISRPRWAR